MSRFDEIVNRNTPEDLKHAKIEGIDDLIPMWVADMDFKSPDEVVEALVEQAKRGVYGYSEADESYDQALVSWYKRRYGWDVDPKTVIKLPGVVLGISYAIRSLTKENDSVLIFEPLYGPIARAVRCSGRNLVISDLVLKNRHYEIDFDDFESKVRENNVKMLILCNPHNPAGRVWTGEELLKIGDICLKNHMLIVSDEIHADFVYSGHKHIPIASLSDELKKITVTCTSATKSFNIAGIQAANIVIADDSMRRAVDKVAFSTGAFGLNTMGLVATRAALTYGDKWMDELTAYLEGNIELVKSRLEGTKLKVTDIEGTYLMWIDASEMGVEDPSGFFLEKAHIRFSEGTFFSKKADQFIRMNIACPRCVVNEALDRMLKLPEVR
ncbi:MAG: pyridoxal phosphate-dependent aminotransferase [Clostridiales bacterium]|nr:pyridoxal phosphate-dependent aminotransferase [Clostridiales bacterium]